MALVEQKFLRLKRPLSRHGAAIVDDLAKMYEAKGLMYFGDPGEEECERLGFPRGGCFQVIEYRKTLDYNREERRAAKKSGQELEPNKFKSIIPEGWKIIPPSPDHPTE